MVGLDGFKYERCVVTIDGLAVTVEGYGKEEIKTLEVDYEDFDEDARELVNFLSQCYVVEFNKDAILGKLSELKENVLKARDFELPAIHINGFEELFYKVMGIITALGFYPNNATEIAEKIKEVKSLLLTKVAIKSIQENVNKLESDIYKSIREVLRKTPEELFPPEVFSRVESVL